MSKNIKLAFPELKESVMQHDIETMTFEVIAAIEKAIEDTGFEQFKATSLFGSNDAARLSVAA